MKLVTFLKRREDMSRDAFVERWLTKHAPMAAIFPGLLRYTLSGATGPDSAADAFAELWFESREACQAAYSSEVGKAGSGDANAYTSRRQQALLDERWLSPTQSKDGSKVVVAVKRPNDTDRQEFISSWSAEVSSSAVPLIGSRAARLCFDEFGLTLNSNPGSDDGLQRGEGAVDGLLEVWAEGEEDLRAVVRALEPFVSALTHKRVSTEILMLRENRIV
jgi:uncharacterized protein (TIGR02118 family)